MNIEKIREIIKSKHTIYDLKVDQRINKIGKGMKLINLKDYELPDYILRKKNNLKEWFD
jgi:beta-1,4-mannosyl-glycoprotein beta-1,4-N-acetylglucosaminyltransferase